MFTVKWTSQKNSGSIVTRVKITCRDCILVEHHQHDYSFLQDACEQVDAEMVSLHSDVKQKLHQNLQEMEN